MVNSKAFLMALIIATTMGAGCRFELLFWGYTNSTMNLPGQEKSSLTAVPRVYRVRKKNTRVMSR